MEGTLSGLSLPPWVNEDNSVLTGPGHVKNLANYGLTLMTHRDEVWLVGGRNITQSMSWQNFMLVYRANTNDLVSKTATPYSVVNPMVVHDENNVYSLGGGYYSSNVSFNFNMHYNISTSAWSVKEPLPVGIYSGFICQSGGLIYIHDGRKNSPANIYASNIAYNINTNTYTTLPNGDKSNIAEPRSKSVCHNNKTIHLIYEKEHVCYNISTKTWTNKTACPENVDNVIGFRGNSIYTISIPSKTVYEYNILDDTWRNCDVHPIYGLCISSKNWLYNFGDNQTEMCRCKI